MNLPAAEDTMGMTPGLQLVKVVEIKPWLDKNGQPKKDDRGWPGIEIVLMNKEKQTISFTNYYCDKPLEDPVRKDPNAKCKSEFYLARFKAALGVPAGAVSSDSIIGRKLYVPIAEEHTVDQAGKPVPGQNGMPLVFNVLVKDFYPYKDGETPPVLDPSVFRTTKQKYDAGASTQTSQTAAPPPTAPATGEGTKPGPADDF